MTDYLEHFQNSYQRVMRAEQYGKDFFAAFYAAFIANDERVAGKFRNTDMARQRQMLKDSLDQMLYFSIDKCSSETIERIAARHGPGGVDITPDFYDLWMESLLETVKRYDPDYDDNIDIAWRVNMAPGIALMKALYRR